MPERFRYYDLDRDLVRMDGQNLVPVSQPLPYWRVANSHILQAAMILLKNTDRESRQRWINAMLWSWYNWMPDYFFQAPASATHKYHPSWANRPDGLLLHSLAVCRVAASLSDLLDVTDQDYNILIFAAWHHDMFKYGDLDAYSEGKMTVHEHPVLAGDFFRLPAVQDAMYKLGVTKYECARAADLISTHAGPYRTSRYSDLKLPECTGTLNRLLYKSDYIASRREDGWIQDQLQQMP